MFWLTDPTKYYFDSTGSSLMFSSNNYAYIYPDNQRRAIYRKVLYKDSIIPLQNSIISIGLLEEDMLVSQDVDDILLKTHPIKGFYSLKFTKSSTKTVAETVFNNNTLGYSLGWFFTNAQ